MNAAFLFALFALFAYLVIPVFTLDVKGSIGHYESNKENLMEPRTTYSPRTNEVRQPFSMKINPMLKHLAERIAYEQGRSLASFVEEAMQKAIAAAPEDALRAAIAEFNRKDREPNVG
jgi:hypothetical protein